MIEEVIKLCPSLRSLLVGQIGRFEVDLCCLAKKIGRLELELGFPWVETDKTLQTDALSRSLKTYGQSLAERARVGYRRRAPSRPECLSAQRPPALGMNVQCCLGWRSLCPPCGRCSDEAL